MPKEDHITIIGGGLAGCEAAWQAANRGLSVTLYEMRPARMTEAHLTPGLAELICSNSLGSNLPDRPAGLLKNELRRLGSLLMECADSVSLPAGGALAVDRERFSCLVEQRIAEHPNIRIERREITSIPDTPSIIATGPLTSPSFSRAIQKITGEDNLFFFDAIAPIVTLQSIDMSIAFRASRHQKDEQADYINCPFSEAEYITFVRELLQAQKHTLHHTDDMLISQQRFFEGCLPIEEMARRGDLSLAYGPMRPVGLHNPHTSQRPFAVVQLRQDNLANSLYNLVGFQTNLAYPEQERVFRLIPGLKNADFIRLGQMHRNSFIASPLLLDPTMQYRQRPDLFFAGQITGMEGYIGSIASGFLAGVNLARHQTGQLLLTFPPATMLGALCHYITHADLHDFQPMKANFGILPEIPAVIRRKRERAALHVRRASSSMERFLESIGWSSV